MYIWKKEPANCTSFVGKNIFFCEELYIEKSLLANLKFSKY